MERVARRACRQRGRRSREGEPRRDRRLTWAYSDTTIAFTRATSCIVILGAGGGPAFEALSEGRLSHAELSRAVGEYSLTRLPEGSQMPTSEERVQELLETLEEAVTPGSAIRREGAQAARDELREM